MLGDALAHPLHAVDEVLARRARPDLRLHGAHVRLAERGIPRDRARLQQRLELPALGPAVVVRQVRVERAHERALLALRTEVRVDLPQRRLDLDARDPAHRLHGEAGRDVDDAALAERLAVAVVVRTADEDHVDVADVVELAGAGLAHADDRELGGGDLSRGNSPAPATPLETRVRATQRDASSAAPAASASRRRDRAAPRRPVTRSAGRRRRSARAAGDSARAARPRTPRRRPRRSRRRRRPHRGARHAARPPSGSATPAPARCGELFGMPQVEVGEARRRAEQRPQGAPALRVALQGSRTARRPGARSARARRAPRRDRRPRPPRRAGRRGRARASDSSSASSASASASRLKPSRARWVRELDRSLADMRRSRLRASRGCSSARSASPGSGTPATPGAC